jgi:mono/diheme cytochrome c family protein
MNRIVAPTLHRVDAAQGQRGDLGETAPMRKKLIALLALGLAAAQARTPPEPPPMPGEYRIDQNGRVDRGTYLGWRLFHSACHACHGVGGTGTAVAPNLLERMPTMTPRDFAAKVLTSYRLVSPADEDSGRGREALLEDILKRDRARARGQVVMPAWDGHADMAPHVLDLYAYLNARASGELGPGQPKVAPRGKR